MKKHACLLCAVLAFASTACSSGKVALEYRLQPGARTRYLWTIDSRTAIESTSEQSTSRMRLVVDLYETVAKAREGTDTLLTITLKPRSLSQEGKPLTPPDSARVAYRLSPDGRIREPVTTNLSEQTASALELGTILSQSRLALPPGPVGIGDRWSTPLRLVADTGSIDLQGRGRLVGFELANKHRLARIENRRSGDITAREQLAGVPVKLRGKTSSEALSRLDVDRGILYTSVARFDAGFDLALEDSGKLTGTMKVSLTSRLDLRS